jgi:hypothetical protein
LRRINIIVDWFAAKFPKGVVILKHSKDAKNAYTTSSTGAVDEGRNETTRLPYTDSISVPASEGTLKKHKKDAKK